MEKKHHHRHHSSSSSSSDASDVESTYDTLFEKVDWGVVLDAIKLRKAAGSWHETIKKELSDVLLSVPIPLSIRDQPLFSPSDVPAPSIRRLRRALRENCTGITSDLITFGGREICRWRGQEKGRRRNNSDDEERSHSRHHHKKKARISESSEDESVSFEITHIEAFFFSPKFQRFPTQEEGYGDVKACKARLGGERGRARSTEPYQEINQDREA